MEQTINLTKNFTYIIGPNGSGKTTLLNDLIVNEYLNKYKIAYLEQQALKNIDRILITVDEILNCSNYFLHNKTFAQKKEEILTYFNIKHLQHKITNHLSGGEKQIVLVCMQLLKDVDLYIFDEPFNNLDTSVIDNLTTYLELLAQKRKVIVISHHLDHIVEDASVYKVNNHQLEEVKEVKYY